MFQDKHIQKLANELNLTYQQAEEFAKRLGGWIDKQGTSKPAIAKGIVFILKNVRSKAVEQKKSEERVLYLQGIKNPILLKYGLLIVKLNKEQGLGARRIAKYLKLNHNAKISHTSIANFLKLQKEHGCLT